MHQSWSPLGQHIMVESDKENSPPPFRADIKGYLSSPRAIFLLVSRQNIICDQDTILIIRILCQSTTSQSLLPRRVLGVVYCWASVVSTCSYVFQTPSELRLQWMVELDLKRSTLLPWCMAVCGHAAWPLQVGAWALVG